MKYVCSNCGAGILFKADMPSNMVKCEKCGQLNWIDFSSEEPLRVRRPGRLFIFWGNIACLLLLAAAVALSICGYIYSHSLYAGISAGIGMIVSAISLKFFICILQAIHRIIELQEKQLEKLDILSRH